MARLLERSVENADRVIAIVFGVYFLWASFWLFQVWQQNIAVIFLDWLWPWAYGIAGVAGLAYALRPWSYDLAALSGSLMALCLLSRSAVVIVTWKVGGDDALPTARTFFAAGTWLGYAFAVASLWILLRRYGVSRRARR